MLLTEHFAKALEDLKANLQTCLHFYYSKIKKE